MPSAALTLVFATATVAVHADPFVAMTDTASVSIANADALGVIAFAERDVKQAAQVLKTHLRPVLKALSVDHHARRIQNVPDVGGLGDLANTFQFEEGASVSDVATQLRSSLCSDEGKALVVTAASGLIALVASTVELPSVTETINAVWPCLCTEFDASDPVYDTLLTALSSGELDLASQAIAAAIPVLFGSSGLCATSCRSAGVQLLEWLISAGSAALALEEVAVAVPWLPNLSTGLAGIPTELGDCVCSGFQWDSFVQLFSNSFTAGVGAGLSSLSGGLVVLASESAVSAISDLAAQFPSFLLGEGGLCATSGCRPAFQRLLAYGLDTGKAALAHYAGAMGGRIVPLAIVEAVSGYDATKLVSCSCGGTFQWEPTSRGLADALAAFAGGTGGGTDATLRRLESGSGESSSGDIGSGGGWEPQDNITSHVSPPPISPPPSHPPKLPPPARPPPSLPSPGNPSPTTSPSPVPPSPSPVVASPEALPPLPFGVNGTTPLPELGLAETKTLIAAVLSAVFSPNLLCSSAACQNVTGQTMAVAAAFSSVVPEIATCARMSTAYQHT